MAVSSSVPLALKEASCSMFTVFQAYLMAHGDRSQPSNQKDLFEIMTLNYSGVKVHDQLLTCEGLFIVHPFSSFKKKSTS